MSFINLHYGELSESYLFAGIAKKVAEYAALHPEKHLYRMGIGDVSLPLAPAVIRALHEAVDEQAHKESFHGYMPECGAGFLREAVAGYYSGRGVALSPEEVFISDGASGNLGSLLDLFSETCRALVIEPTYPAYVDANVMAGHEILHLPSGSDDGFTPEPDDAIDADIVYICSPANPTGAVFTRGLLQKWVDWANKKGAVILFDAAYEAFIEDPDVPHSIYELSGARTAAIEICSLSKTAGFTGTRCGYTVIPKSVIGKAADGSLVEFNKLWNRRHTTKFNGTAYIVQRGAAAIYTAAGQQQVKETIAYYMENARIIREGLQAAGITAYGGVNAPYIWLQTPDNMPSWDFFDKLLTEVNIVGTPGAGFGPCGEGYFRLTAFGDRENTLRAVERIKNKLHI